MLIFVSKPTGGANLRLEVELEDLVEALKIRIKDSEGYELEEITLVSGVIVLENDRSLNEYRLQNESTLTLVSRNELHQSSIITSSRYVLRFPESWKQNSF